MKKVKFIPVDIVAPGTLKDKIETWIKKTGIVYSIELLKKGNILETAKNNTKSNEHLLSEKKMNM